jgi:urease accessory protein
MIRLVKYHTGSGAAAATLTLPYEKRIKSRLKVILDNGERAGLFLERGRILRGGDRLEAEDGSVVEIISAHEAVSTARTTDTTLLCRACYHLGNRHVPLQIGETWVRYLCDHVLDEMVSRLGLDLETGDHPFEPEAGAWGGHHHGHAH